MLAAGGADSICAQAEEFRKSDGKRKAMKTKQRMIRPRDKQTGGLLCQVEGSRFNSFPEKNASLTARAVRRNAPPWGSRGGGRPRKNGATCVEGLQNGDSAMTRNCLKNSTICRFTRNWLMNLCSGDGGVGQV